MKWIIIDGGDRNSRSLALNSILYRFIAYNVNNLSSWDAISRTYTSTLLKLAEQYKYRDSNDDSLRDSLKNAHLLCIEDVCPSELSTPVVKEILDDIFTSRQRNLESRTTIISIDNRNGIDTYGACLGAILSTGKMANNPTDSMAIIRVA